MFASTMIINRFSTVAAQVGAGVTGRASSIVASSVVASIPSPHSGALHIGSLQLRAYGLMIALGVIAAVALAGRRLEWAGTGRRDDMAAAAMYGVPAGVIGARLYHVITDWRSFRGDWGRVFKIWEGGLGIWGGIALGVIVGVWALRRRGVRTVDTLGAVAPALALAQAIGRWGNWWNQELFGRPTTLPWALEIDPVNRPPAYATASTFHPTFLYESIWNLLLCVALLQIDRRYRPRGDRLFAMYVAGYTFARFFIERLRIDQASKVLGLRVNEWVAGLVFLAAVAYLVRTRNAPTRVAVAGADGELLAAADGTVAGAADSDITGVVEASGDGVGEPAEHAIVEDGGEPAEHAIVDDGALNNANDDDEAVANASADEGEPSG